MDVGVPRWQQLRDVERSVGVAVGCPVALAVGLRLGDHDGGVHATVVVVEHASDQAGSHPFGGARCAANAVRASI